MRLFEELQTPTPEFEIWPVWGWIAVIVLTLVGVIAYAFAQDIIDVVQATWDEFLPIQRVVVGLVLALAAGAVLFTVFYSSHQIPRHMDAPGLVRVLATAPIIAAGIAAAIRLRTWHFWVRVGVAAFPAGAVVLGWINDGLSRVAAGIPVNVGVIYVIASCVVAWVMISALRTR